MVIKMYHYRARIKKKMALDSFIIIIIIIMMSHGYP